MEVKGESVNLSDWKQSFQVASVYVGTVVEQDLQPARKLLSSFPDTD